MVFWRFHRFEKQFPHLVHSLSQLCDIFGIYAVGVVDPLADLIDIHPDFVDLCGKFSLLRVIDFDGISVDQHFLSISML